MMANNYQRLLLSIPQDNNDEPSHGYDVELLDQSDLKENSECAVCLFVLRNPMQVVPCGHRFCKSCSEKLRNKRCPIDRKFIENFFEDVGREREILNLKVKCTNNKSFSCEWTGELKQLEDHVSKNCLYQTIRCKNKDCRFLLQRKDLSRHLKEKCQYEEIKCSFCENKILRKNMNEHQEICDEFPLECSNKCGEKNIKRVEMKNHIKEKCPKTIHSCKYLEVGCEIKGTREFLQEHVENDMENHLEQQGNEIKKQGNEINKLKATIKNGKVNEKRCLFKPNTKLSTPTMNAIKKKHVSRNFFFNGYQISFGFAVFRNQCMITYHILKGPFDESLQWPMLYDSVQISYSTGNEWTKLNLTDFVTEDNGTEGCPNSFHYYILTEFTDYDVERLELAIQIIS